MAPVLPDSARSRTVIVAFYQLGRGGATQAVLDQAKTFCEAGYRVIIATFNHEQKLDEWEQSLKASGRLAQSVELRNLHVEAQRNQEAYSSARRRIIQLYQRIYWRLPVLQLRARSADVKGGTKVHIFDRRGVPRQVRHVDAKQRAVQNVRFLRSGMRLVEKVSRARVARKYWELPGDEHPFLEQYFAPDGFAYMTRTLNARTGHGTGVTLFSRRSKQTQHFNGIPAWQISWLQGIVDEAGDDPIVIAESPSLIPKVAKLRGGSSLKIGMLHNNHNAYPHTPGSEIRDDHKEIFDSISDLDRLIVLTTEQRGDIVNRFGFEEKISVIPNIVEFPQLGVAERNPSLVGIITRLHPIKAIDQAIEAFRLVVEECPDARLKIWGAGPEQKKLLDLIENLDLQEAVTLMGRTESTNNAYQQCAFTLSTSSSEAFGLSVAESMLNETPVIAYDYSFGARALIEDEVSGRLITQRNVEELSLAMLELLRAPDTARRMGRNARQAVSRVVSADAVLAKWESTFQEFPDSHRD